MLVTKANVTEEGTTSVAWCISPT